MQVPSFKNVLNEKFKFEMTAALAHAHGQSGVSTRATAISSHGGWVNGFA